MSWLSTSTRAIVLAAAAIAMLAPGVCTRAAHAQSLESAIMPGDVARAHVKQESDCKHCHVRFDRAAQPRLCLDCHKPVAADMRAKAGYHGRLKDNECKTCHTEHKGRDAKIVPALDKNFDHAQTDFILKRKHRDLACEKCHRPNIKHSAAPSTCAGCHRKDDKHKDTLGSKCESCHDENNWKETSFDHAKTKFALLLKHAKVKCVDCHADSQHLANTPRDCVSCHRKDDKHKGTLSARCDQCHNEGNWKEARFDHAKTHFPLLLGHAKVKCAACHADPQHFAHTTTKCNACHHKQDAHKAALGDKCEVCHNEKSWKEAPRFDHDRDSRYPLREAHRKAKCDSCHQDASVGLRDASVGLRDASVGLKDARIARKDARDVPNGPNPSNVPTLPNVRLFGEKPPTACFRCHEREDRDKGHKGRYGEKCETCHVEKTFKAATFEHGRDARYALRGKHQPVKCDTCHKGILYRDKLETRCIACHEPDDKHKGQLGKDCARCHAESSWRESSFDHNRSDFPLRERHAGLDCKKCHASPLFKDAKTDCASCHAKDDAHKARLGTRCEQCHSARGWKIWAFDHNLRSRFKLLDKHAKVKCLACHLKPVTDKVVLAVECVSCHRRDDIHFETKGPQCERCHAPDNWRRVINQEGGRKPP